MTQLLSGQNYTILISNLGLGRSKKHRNCYRSYPRWVRQSLPDNLSCGGGAHYLQATRIHSRPKSRCNSSRASLQHAPYGSKAVEHVLFTISPLYNGWQVRDELRDRAGSNNWEMRWYRPIPCGHALTEIPTGVLVGLGVGVRCRTVMGGGHGAVVSTGRDKRGSAYPRLRSTLNTQSQVGNNAARETNKDILHWVP